MQLSPREREMKLRCWFKSVVVLINIILFPISTDIGCWLKYREYGGSVQSGALKLRLPLFSLLIMITIYSLSASNV